MKIELAKHVQKQRGVQGFECGQPSRPATVVSHDGIQCVQQSQHELKNLQLSNVLFEPRVLFQVGSGTAERVVGVHDGVHEHVEDRQKAGIRTGVELEAEPGHQRHDGMMKNVQKGRLVSLLSKHKKDGVHPVEEFGNKVQPSKVDNDAVLETAVARVYGGTVPRSGHEVGDPHGQQKGGRVEADQKTVVDEHESAQLKRFAILHQSWTNPLNEKDVESDKSDRSVRRTLHERQFVRARIAIIIPRIVQPELK